MSVTVYAPASIGNISVGFDILGAAITPLDGALLGDCVTVQAADTFSLTAVGPFSNKLPRDPQQNLAYLAWQAFKQQVQPDHLISLQLSKNMPIGSGLGSSACSIVATLVALNHYYQQPLTDQALLQLMGEIEGKVSGSIHYDNVAPSFLGGIQLLIEESPPMVAALPHFTDWLWVMAYPGIKMATARARAVLPTHYQRAIAIEQNRHLATFIHASHRQDALLAANAMQDLFAEPYRAELLPGFSAMKQRLANDGVLACGISGSGPTLFAICQDKPQAELVAMKLRQHYVQNERGFVHICRIDPQGARVIA